MLRRCPSFLPFFDMLWDINLKFCITFGKEHDTSIWGSVGFGSLFFWSTLQPKVAQIYFSTHGLTNQGKSFKFGEDAGFATQVPPLKFCFMNFAIFTCALWNFWSFAEILIMFRLNNLKLGLYNTLVVYAVMRVSHWRTFYYTLSESIRFNTTYLNVICIYIWV